VGVYIVVAGRFQLHELKIELTQRCPLACLHCSTSSHRRQSSSLPPERVVRLLEEAAELGVEKVVFTGGEPLVYPSLRQVISKAHECGIRATIYTTVFLHDSLVPISDSDAAELVRLGISRFIFSVYSGSAAIHESITRYGTFAPTIAAIRSVVAAGVPVEMHFVAMRRNFRHLPDVVALADGLGASRVSVLRFVPQGRGVRVQNSEDLSEAEFVELKDMIHRARYRHPKVNIRAGSPLNFLHVGFAPCNAAQDVLIINHRGDIFPCDAFKNVIFEEPQFGSILHQSLKAVWENSLYLRTVREILDRHRDDACQACSTFDGCKTGCLAQKVIKEGWSGTTHDTLVQISSCAPPSVESVTRELHPVLGISE
jgi:radical SAM protein with 4Fe4S-binding SPASM domain